MPEKLSSEEFKLLQDIRQDAIDIATTLGEIGYQKIILELQEQEQKERIRDIKADESAFFENLRNKYGNVVLDIETGELSPKDK
jgi:hypothetical protein